ncbi:FkbM family methyltransferase [Streptomyces wuyuanensis]|uniref:FkbM family methyltransferase n=1 Tax=Streptomyces wuyuanensis TaxID=1196353 RepID=UPI003D740218
MSLMGKVRWILQHPAFRAQPATSLARLASWRARTALGVGATVPMEDSTTRLWCPPEWRGNAKLTYLWRNAYESELAQLHRWVGPGDYVVDVGAHYGAYALPMSRIVSAEGVVAALEPSRHARQILHRNIRINHANNVCVLPVAAGRDTTQGTLHLHKDRSRASLSKPTEDEAGHEPVEVVRLDDVLSRDRRVALIKMDIEGYEQLALEGAESILSKDRPVVIFEYTPPATAAAGLPAHGAWDTLISHGYRMHRVTDRGEVVQVPHPDQRCDTTDNIVAIHPASKQPNKGERR